MNQVKKVFKKITQLENILTKDHQNNGIESKVTSLVDDIKENIALIDSSSNQNLYRLIFEKAPIGILHYDINGVITACNSKFVEILGSSREKLMGLSMTELPNKELVQAVNKALKGSEGVFEGRYVTVTSGKTIYVRVIFQPIEPSGGVAMVEDITESHEALQKLKESELRFRSIFENNHSVMLLIDPMDGQIVDANPAAIDFYGWTQEEIQKKKISDINTLSEKEVEREMKKAKTNKTNLFHFKHRLADNTVRDVEVYSGTIQMNGQILLYSIVNDISERIRKSNDLLKFKLGIERSGNVVFITDQNGVIEYVNEAFTKVYGYEKKEVVGKTPQILNSGKHSKEFYRNFWETILRGEKIEVKILNKTANGEILYIKASANPILDDEGELQGFIAIQQDMTSEERAKEKLNRAEQQLRDIVEHSTNMFYTHDVKGNLTYVSPQSKEIFGIEPEEALRNWTDFITDHPENEKAKKLTDRAIQTREVQPSYRLQIKRADGELIWVVVNESPLIKNGEIVGIVGSFTDITNEVEAQKKSERHRILLDELTNATSAAVWARKCDNSYLFTNNEYKRLFGAKDENLLGKTVDEVFDVDIATQFTQNDQKVLEKDKSLTYERWLSIDGEERFFRINMFPLHELPGLEKCVGGVALDITDQKRNEEVIKESLKEKETLLSEIHHRVKNNLATISALLELNTEQIEDEKTIGFIQNSQLRIQSMAKVHELLYQTKSFSQISFKDYIESIIDSIDLVMKRDGFKPNFITSFEDIELNINQAIPCGMLANELIMNSIKHAFPHEQSGDIKISFYADNGDVVLSVEDSGVGVDDDFDETGLHSFGMTLINIFSQQLHADLHMGNTVDGFQTTVKFRLEKNQRGSAGNL